MEMRGGELCGTSAQCPVEEVAEHVGHVIVDRCQCAEAVADTPGEWNVREAMHTRRHELRHLPPNFTTGKDAGMQVEVPEPVQ